MQAFNWLDLKPLNNCQDKLERPLPTLTKAGVNWSDIGVLSTRKNQLVGFEHPIESEDQLEQHNNR